MNVIYRYMLRSEGTWSDFVPMSEEMFPEIRVTLLATAADTLRLEFPDSIIECRWG